jgi:hypothetical protein
MGHHPDPEASGEAPQNRELAWACVSSDPLEANFFADRDLSRPGITVCRPLSELPGIIKGGYYIVKLLNELAKFGTPAAFATAVDGVLQDEPDP